MASRRMERAYLCGRADQAMGTSDAIDRAAGQGATPEQIASLAWGEVELAVADLALADPKAAQLAARMDREQGGPEMEPS